MYRCGLSKLPESLYSFNTSFKSGAMQKKSMRINVIEKLGTNLRNMIVSEYYRLNKIEQSTYLSITNRYNVIDPTILTDIMMRIDVIAL